MISTPVSLIIFLAAVGVVAQPSSNDGSLAKRQATPCFVEGSVPLTDESARVADSLSGVISCDFLGSRLSRSGGVSILDVSSNSVSFSSVDYKASDLSPLAFSLQEFSTTEPLADNDSERFLDMLDVYLATQVGLESQGAAEADIQIPISFLQLQVARIQTAQANPEALEAGQTVEDRLAQVLSLTADEDQDLIDKVNELAETLE